MSTLSELEAQKRGLENTVKYKRDFEALLANPLFKSIIVDGYLQDEAVRLLQLSCDLASTAEQRADALEMAKATGQFKQWLIVQAKLTQHAEEQLLEINETIDIVRAEENEE